MRYNWARWRPRLGLNRDDYEILSREKISRPAFSILWIVMLLYSTVGTFVVFILLDRSLLSGGLVSGQVLFPRIGQRTVTFREAGGFLTSPDSYEAVIDKLWQEIVPDGNGCIQVSNPSKWGLSGGYPIENKAEDSTVREKYCIAMYHSLHCVNLLQHRANEKVHNSVGSEDQGNIEKHLTHCVDYLIQAILCAGDTTLEAADTVNGTIMNTFFGWGTSHKCRNSDTIYDFTIANKFVD